jgi:hypothetical protein
MSWSLIHALAVARGGGIRSDIWAGMAAGLACATKWPAILVLIAPITGRTARKWVLIAPTVAVATLLLASPYLLPEWRVVLRDLGGEARPIHLGATGYGFLGNLWWYLSGPFARSLTWSGIACAILGAATLPRKMAATILPFAGFFLAALAAQSLVWERWVVPLLPIVTILTASGIARIAGRVRIAAMLALVVLAAWCAQLTLQRQNDRADDPRQRAAAWLLANAKPNRTILVESAAFDLLPYKGRLLFPLGAEGCIDARALLASKPSHKTSNEKRAGKSIVDLGHVEISRAETCKADYTVTTNFSRYRAAGRDFTRERHMYEVVLARSRRIAVFHPLDIQRDWEHRTVEVWFTPEG